MPLVQDPLDGSSTGAFFPNGTLQIGESMSFFTKVPDITNGNALSMYPISPVFFTTCFLQLPLSLFHHSLIFNSNLADLSNTNGGLYANVTLYLKRGSLPSIISNDGVSEGSCADSNCTYLFGSVSLLCWFSSSCFFSFSSLSFHSFHSF